MFTDSFRDHFGAFSRWMKPIRPEQFSLSFCQRIQVNQLSAGFFSHVPECIGNYRNPFNLCVIRDIEEPVDWTEGTGRCTDQDTRVRGKCPVLCDQFPVLLLKHIL